MTPDKLRTLFLFESLDEDKLAWLAEHSTERDLPAGVDIATQGEPAEWFFVLLSGKVSLRYTDGNGTVELNRTDERGVYGGAFSPYLSDQGERGYPLTLHALTDVHVAAWSAAEFGARFSSWFPMAVHLLSGLVTGQAAHRSVVGNRERLTALGTITAGLTHELNNPAAAASRAADGLRDNAARAHQLLVGLAEAGLEPDRLRRLTDFVAGYERVTLTPIETADAEDELGEWLDERDAADPWDLAGTLVADGVTVAAAERVAEITGEHAVGALAWIGEALEVTQLIEEITDATRRISTLLGSAKQYSQLDRTAHSPADLRELLDSTLAILKVKIGPRVRVVTDYDPDLPPVPAYAAELNQVWTNLIANALDAMAGQGTLTVRTRNDHGSAVVEIGDTGSGIADEVRDQIFTPFFTTKAVGEGTGLGLDITWRIVVNRHHGSIDVESTPGDTRFTVRLPLSQSSDSGTSA